MLASNFFGMFDSSAPKPLCPVFLCVCRQRLMLGILYELMRGENVASHNQQGGDTKCQGEGTRRFLSFLCPAYLVLLIKGSRKAAFN
jgi:hypothetical protein